MIEVVNLKKKYKKNEAVKGINLFLEKGESVGLLGPNGAGKSTAISLIASSLKPTSGEVRLNGKVVWENPKEMRKIVGVVPQEIALYHELSAEDNLLFFGKIYKMDSKRLKQRIEETLKLVGLYERKKDRVKTYSGGMKRRLNIAASMLHQPEFLIMDEPTVGIDPQSRNHILNLVRQLQSESNVTVLYTSHYMEEVEAVCDRVYIMDQGNIIASGTISELKAILSSDQTVELAIMQSNEALYERLKQNEAFKVSQKSELVYKIIAPHSYDLFDLLVNQSNEIGVKIKALEVKSPTLEDVFLHLTGRNLRD
ncbi:antibiotic ABC transporter ATP-binding protein [Alkalihalobacillus alcalophilus ATCC 27647 = CGMCC 1.3604]|uniref:Antibiotic ABC transporter ATP-binding protein n=1 Tax=Alkalihalobacillus alcalophilus ATCC 27647 = CGMCC 1.3604 TaxID=1218173 RepID=A0A094YVE4_ALKAL|nr:ABC transporter ATP-binding protein [Alkalihalobacillus alcalophilus]KGA97487.1 antibiotic ABC transporter ATP-binding protein [Alkalihalobacillus alcalophilus ATCC 27647 = CGMCC 1.3604]MED1563270.1 ABC transporter ATP-binding protein [Alkalihalobacillus alcalophilus]THG91746.1 antibiotic ABC transporter ATP-binding protein [Alkalihalobacillus alcalophilus ATCC 27647 = CGMCC 1.3604]